MNWTPLRFARKCWNRILHFFGRRFWTVYVDGDLPSVLRDHVVYIVLDDDEPWHASFVCPCGCGQLLHMNLLDDEHPCWQVLDHFDGTVSLHPSVWRNIGCKSHFWLQRGKIKWCRR